MAGGREFKVLNTTASKGSMPIVMRWIASPGEDMEQDRAYDEHYTLINILERESTETRINLRIIICCLKIVVRWSMSKLDTPWFS
jgi:hypothetical protein